MPIGICPDCGFAAGDGDPTKSTPTGWFCNACGEFHEFDRAGVASLRETCLAEARQAIVEDRARAYGPPEENFARIAALWTILLGARMKIGSALTPVDVALCLDALKSARLVANPSHADSWIDKVGYSALGYELGGGSHDLP